MMKARRFRMFTMARISTEQFDRTVRVVKTAARRVWHSWPARILRTIHHESYQSVQSAQADLSERESSAKRSRHD